MYARLQIGEESNPLILEAERRVVQHCTTESRLENCDGASCNAELLQCQFRDVTNGSWQCSRRRRRCKASGHVQRGAHATTFSIEDGSDLKVWCTK